MWYVAVFNAVWEKYKGKKSHNKGCIYIYVLRFLYTMTNSAEFHCATITCCELPTSRLSTDTRRKRSKRR